MNFISTATFSLTASLIYRYKRSLIGAIVALMSAAVATVGVMMLFNLWITPYYMGVSVKTVEAWEAGRNHPDGPACRLLELTQKDPNFAKNSGIVIT